MVPSVKKNYIFNTILQIVLLIVPIITTPYVSRVLGVNKVGEYSYASAMVTYFVLAAVLGTGSYGQRQIAFSRDSKEELSLSFWNTLLFRTITTVFCLAAYFTYLFFTKNVNFVCLALSINILNVAFDLTWFFQGIENFKSIVAKNVIIKLISLVLIFVLVRRPGDLGIYTLILSGSTILGSFSLWLSIRRKICFVKFSRINPFHNIKDILLIFLPTIAIQVYTILDKTMIGWITKSSYANGCYDKAEQISRIALTLVTSIAAVVLPRISNLFKTGDHKKMKEYVYKAYRFVWMLSIPIFLGLVIVSPTFIPIFLGNGYDDAIVLLRIFSLLVIFVSLSYVTGLSYLVSTKQQNVYTVAVTIAAIVNLCMNLLLIKKYSAIGAAVSSICAEFIGCAIQIGFCVLTKQLNWKKIFGPMIKYFFAGIFMFVFLLGVNNFQMIPMVKLIVIVCLGALIYYAFLIVMRDDLVIQETKIIFNKIFKKQSVIAHR